jgi:aspartate/methionine/tyrosine aminotransferase
MSKKSSATKSSRVARRVASGQPSIMSELVIKARTLKDQGRNVVDLGAGVPDYQAPDFLVQAGIRALCDGPNSYGDGRGMPSLRKAVAQRFAATQGVSVDADTEVTITGGASAAITATLLALVNPRDAVAMFEPYFEYFLPQIQLAGGTAKFIPLHAPDWTFKECQLKRALSGRTRVLLLNTPHNPTGRVFTRAELERIAHYCIANDIIVISDETYEPFTFDCEHISIASLPGMAERTVTIHSVSKVFNVAGWRIGSVIAPPAITAAIRKVNNLSLGAPVPLQEACARAMTQYDSFVGALVARHKPLRDQLCAALRDAGFEPFVPEGTLSVFAECSSLGLPSDIDVCDYLLNVRGLLAAPGSAFFRVPGKQFVRFSFARQEETIAAAISKLREIRAQ